MNESIIIIEKIRQQFSARAKLVGLGMNIHKLRVLKPIKQQVQNAQKRVKYIVEAINGTRPWEVFGEGPTKYRNVISRIHNPSRLPARISALPKKEI